MNFYGKINLLKLFGAYVTTDAAGQNVVVIPCEHNDLTLFQSQQTGKIVSADLSINLNELSEDARMKNAANNQGKENYIPPTHFVKLGMSKDSFNKKFPNAAAKQIAQHPEWSNLGYEQKLPDGSYNPLYTSVNNVLHPIIGDLRQSGGSVQQFNGAAPKNNLAPAGGFYAPQQDDDLPF